MRALLLALVVSLACPVSARPVCDIEPSAPAPRVTRCKRTTWRYIGTERVPWDHDEDDHDWDEFDHSEDECEPPPC